MSIAIPTLTLQAVTRVEPDSRTGDIAGQSRARAAFLVPGTLGITLGICAATAPAHDQAHRAALVDLPKGGALATVTAHLHDSPV